jgi:hypothetical protein
VHAPAALHLAETPERIALAVVGLVLLVAGRKVFWLAVGALGFVAGYEAMAQWGTRLPPTAHLVVAIALGVVGLVLAIVVQRVAVALAGFFLGVVVTALVLPHLGLALGPWAGLVVAAGGIVAAAIALALLSLALVVLTAGAGASLLAQAAAVPPPWPVVLLVTLWLVGIVVQRRTTRGRA